MRSLFLTLTTAIVTTAMAGCALNVDDDVIEDWDEAAPQAVAPQQVAPSPPDEAGVDAAADQAVPMAIDTPTELGGPRPGQDRLGPEPIPWHSTEALGEESVRLGGGGPGAPPAVGSRPCCTELE